MGENHPTHYQVLGLARNATDREVKIAYRKAARIAHPDRGGDPALFRQITEAYEVLADPQRRQAYDRSYGTTTNRPGPSGAREARSPFAAGSNGFSAFNTKRSEANRSTAGDPAVYVPPYESLAAGQPPIMPRATAAQPVHGVPRKRGVFGASSRLAREARTAQLIMQQVLPAIPAARLVNGLSTPGGKGHLDHILFSGYRMAVIGSMLVPEGAFRWDGNTLLHGNKFVAPPQLVTASRQLQELFPECNVTAWVCVHSNTGNLFEPVIDYARGTTPDGSNALNVANAARFVREMKQFLGSGPAPNVVDLGILDRLLGGMY